MGLGMCSHLLMIISSGFRFDSWNPKIKHSKLLLTHIQDSISYETHYQTKLNIINFHTLSCKAYVYNHLPNLSCVSKKAFLLDILTLKNPIRHIFLLNSVCWTLFNIQFNTITMMSGQLQADGEEQFLYSSLKSIFWPTEIKLKFRLLKLQKPFQMNLHHLQGQQPLKLYSLPLCLIHC